MFCDLVDSTELAERLDPEDLHELVFRYQRTCAAVVARYEGHVAQYLGDGLLVYFGYPRAHEDDAVRAARTAIDALRAIDALNEELEVGFGVRIGVRMGIHSGPIVLGDVGEGEGRERLALGETVNLASRLQHLAEPGTVLISGATRRLVQGLFVLEDFTVRQLKGVSEPVETYRLVQPSGVRRRASGAGGPFVGREDELDRLLEVFEQVASGRGHLVGVAGEAGIGKSRLVEAFAEHLPERRHTWVDCRCSPLGEGSPFAPVIEAIEQGLQLAPEDAAEERLLRLERALEAIGAPRAEVLPLLAPLFGLPAPEHAAPLQLSVEAQRRLILDVLIDWMVALARLQPLVLVVEDAQWIDPSSRALFERLGERAADLAILLLVTHRGVCPLAWRSAAGRASLELHPLEHGDGLALVESLGGRELPEPIRQALVARADGVPLFLEELTLDLLESGPSAAAASEGPGEIPATLQQSLLARLDRLGPVREVAQLAAAIGREFSEDLLERVMPQELGPARPALESLVAAGLVQPCTGSPARAYAFKHGLVQEAAYGSLLRSARRRHHARIADVLEAEFPQRAAAAPEELARHCEEAGQIERAVACWRLAARQALGRWANAEAAARLEHALVLLSDLPCAPMRTGLELDLLIDLGSARLATTGYATEEVRDHYERTRQLAERAGEADRLVRPLISLSAASALRGELPTARQLAQQAVELAGASEPPGALLFACIVRSLPRFLAGDFSKALVDLELTMERHRAAEAESMIETFGQDPGVIARCWAGWALWIQGLEREALACTQQALELARASGHAPGVAAAEVFAAIQHQLRGEPEEVLAHGRAAQTIASELGLALFVGASQVLAAWAEPCGDPAAATARLEAGLRHIEATGGEALLPYFLALGAGVEWRCERNASALGRLAAAEALQARTGACFWRAELLRLEGELRLAEPATRGRAAACFREAAAAARQQSAVGLQRRVDLPARRRAGPSTDRIRLATAYE